MRNLVFKYSLLLVTVVFLSLSSALANQREFERLVSNNCSEAMRFFKEASSERQLVYRDYLYIILKESNARSLTGELALGIQDATSSRGYLPGTLSLEPMRPSAASPQLSFLPVIDPQQEIVRKTCSLNLLMQFPAMSSDKLYDLWELASSYTLLKAQYNLQIELAQLILKVVESSKGEVNEILQQQLQRIVEQINSDNLFYAELIFRQAGKFSLGILIEKLRSSEQLLTPQIASLVLEIDPELSLLSQLYQELMTSSEPQDIILMHRLLRGMNGKGISSPSSALLSELATQLTSTNRQISDSAIQTIQIYLDETSFKQLSAPAIQAILVVAETSPEKLRNSLLSFIIRNSHADQNLMELLEERRQAALADFAGQVLYTQGVLFPNDKSTFARLIEGLMSNSVYLQISGIDAISHTIVDKERATSQLVRYANRVCSTEVSVNERLKVVTHIARAINKLTTQSSSVGFIPCLWDSLVLIEDILTENLEVERERQLKEYKEALIPYLLEYGERVVKFVQRDLRNANYRVRILAGLILSDIGIKEVLVRRQLVGLLTDDEIGVRQQIASKLSEFKNINEPSLVRLYARSDLKDRLAVSLVLSSWNLNIDRGFVEQFSAEIKAMECKDLAWIAKELRRDEVSLNESLQEALVRCIISSQGELQQKFLRILAARGPLNYSTAVQILEYVGSQSVAESLISILFLNSENLLLPPLKLSETIAKIASRDGINFQYIILLQLSHYVPYIREHLQKISEISPLNVVSEVLVKGYLRDTSISSALIELVRTDPSRGEVVVRALEPDFILGIFSDLLKDGREQEIILGLHTLSLLDFSGLQLPTEVITLSSDPRLSIRVASINLLATARPESKFLLEALKQLFVLPDGLFTLQANYLKKSRDGIGFVSERGWANIFNNLYVSEDSLFYRSISRGISCRNFSLGC